MENMIKEFKGLTIEKNINSHCALIYKGSVLLKCITGDIYDNDTDNSIVKAKNWIIQYNNLVR